MFRAILSLMLIVLGASVFAQPKDGAAPHVDLIAIDGSINPAVDDFIREGIARAKHNGARALIIQLVRYTLLANGVPGAAALVVKAVIIVLAVWLQRPGR